MNWSSHHLIAGILIPVTLGLAENASAQCRYELVIPPGNVDGQENVFYGALGLGEDGTMAGSFDTAEEGLRAWAWSGEDSMVRLKLPAGHTYSVVTSLIDRSAMVGYAFTPDYRKTIPVIWRDDEPYILPIPDGINWSFTNSINRRGDVILGGIRQESTLAGVGALLPVMWINGRYRKMEVPAGYDGFAVSMNNRNWIVGSVSVAGQYFGSNSMALWRNHRLQMIVDYPGASDTYGVCINNAGVVIGFAEFMGASKKKSFVWKNGIFRTLEPPAPWSTVSAIAINDSNRIVGILSNGNFQENRAYIWINDKGFDLNDLIVKGDEQFVIRTAKGINNRGEILVYASSNVGSALLIPVGSPLGDIDKNCIVNEQDLLLLVREFGNEDSYADVDGDGDVDRDDLLMLIRNFGASNVP